MRPNTVIFNPDQMRADALAHLRMKLLDWYQQTCDAVPREYDRRMPPDWQWEKVKNACDPAWAKEIHAMILDGAGPAKVGAMIEQLKRERG